MLIDIIGWAAIFVLIPATWFQIIENFKRKSTEGVSPWMFWSLFLGLGMLFIVAVAENSHPVIILNYFLGSSSAAVALLQDYLYARRGSAAAAEKNIDETKNA